MKGMELAAVEKMIDDKSRTHRVQISIEKS